MKVIIAGSRDITDYGLVIDAVEKSGFNITEVVSGTARGVDKLGERYAMDECIPIKRFPAKWKKYGKKAGYIRNEEMVNYIEKHNGGAILIWDGTSKGTKNTIDLIKARNLKFHLTVL